MRHPSVLTRSLGSVLPLLALGLLTACQNEAPAADRISPLTAAEADPAALASSAGSSSNPESSALEASPPQPGGSALTEVVETPRAPAPANACVLLPASEVEPIIGGAIRDSIALAIRGTAHSPPVSQCNYGTLRNPAAASLLIRGIADGQTTQAAADSIRQNLARANIPLEDVEGLGEISFWGANQLHVFPGNGWQLVVSPEPGVGLPQAREMAERAMARF